MVFSQAKCTMVLTGPSERLCEKALWPENRRNPEDHATEEAMLAREIF